ncbi:MULTISPECIES: AraC family transcriptional regulator [unclassified Flavobacterium]|uniref:helix-turn-helix domain-containing protein n=1 Tax=unclassified Flavobacterium TaxID=196869 RepID=UPI00188BFCF5|nr:MULTISPECIES: helix-turn-helix domain-containing protein [unclassified Flavobacterium]MBF4484880.1 AraC family transcriptional regulator [Flavobacterium sp. CSZ]
MKNKITTYSLEDHKSLFNADNNKDYFYIQAKGHPYISEPYRAESYAIEFLRKGSIVMQTKLKKMVIHAPAILTLGPSVIRSFTKDSDEILIDIIFFKSPFFLHNQANVFFLSQYEFFDNSEMHVFHLEKKNKVKFEQIFSLLRQSIEHNNDNQPSILRAYLYILIYELDAIKQTNINGSKQNPLFEKFKEMLSRDFLSQRSVQYYADILNVTRKYLSEVIKNNSGKTASDWIEEIVILEAKILLQNKDLTINQISDTLNFPNQSGFGRFFKKCEGISPLEYRRKKV